MNLSQLFQKTSQYSESTNIEMFDKLFFILQKWLMNKKDISIINDFETIQYHFYIFLLSLDYQCIKNNNYDNDFILIKYSDEIIDMFIDFKEITRSYGSQYLHEKNRTADQLLHFIHTFTESYTENEFVEDYNNEHILIDYYDDIY